MQLEQAVLVPVLRVNNLLVVSSILYMYDMYIERNRFASDHQIIIYTHIKYDIFLNIPNNSSRAAAVRKHY